MIGVGQGDSVVKHVVTAVRNIDHHPQPIHLRDYFSPKGFMLPCSDPPASVAESARSLSTSGPKLYIEHPLSKKISTFSIFSPMGYPFSIPGK